MNPTESRWWPRVARRARRDGTPLAVVAAVLSIALIALVVGLVIVSLQKQEAERQRGRAEARVRKAGETIERLLDRIGQERLTDVTQMKALHSSLLEDALQLQLSF